MSVKRSRGRLGWVSLWLSCALTLMLSLEARADLLVRGYSPATANLYDRFNNSPTFIGSGFDWSGVARTSTGRWGTMVSANYFLSAYHFAPSIGETLTLYGSNDINGPQQVVNIIGGQQIAGTDLWLGQVDQATNFATYGVLASNAVVGHEVFMFGVAGGFPIAAQQRLGRNHVEAYFQDFTLGATGDIYIYDYDDPVGGVGPDEAMVQGGDSGAPTFMIMNNQPVLLGFHWFNYTGAFSDSTSGSGDTAVARYITAINQAMVGQQVISIVPEPGSMALVGIPLAGWLWRRRLTKKKAATAAA